MVRWELEKNDIKNYIKILINHVKIPIKIFLAELLFIFIFFLCDIEHHPCPEYLWNILSFDESELQNHIG